MRKFTIVFIGIFLIIGAIQFKNYLIELESDYWFEFNYQIKKSPESKFLEKQLEKQFK